MTQQAMRPPEETIEVLDLKASRRSLIAGGLGHGIEWYEFAIYAYMAPIIAPLFFPSDNPVTSILSTFAVLATAFLMRPVGALVFGRMTDRIGRKPALVIIILLMSAATTAIGLLPTAGTIGAWAGVLLIVCRLTQGLAGGGEMGGAVSLMVENAPPGKRGFYGSWSFAATGFGFVAGATVATLLTLGFSDEALSNWAWRIPFLLALPLGLVALIVRLKVDETPHFKRMKAARATEGTSAPIVNSPNTRFSILLATFAVVVIYVAVGNTFQVGMPSYLTTAYEMDVLPAYLLALITGVVGSAAVPFFGALSDKVGRLRVLLWGASASAALSYPLYWLMDQGFTGGVVALFAAGILIGAVGGPMPAFIAERFPTRNRATGTALTYGLASAIFGGAAPFIITWLYSVTGDSLAGAYYTIGTGLIAVAGCVYLMKYASTYSKGRMEEVLRD